MNQRRFKGKNLVFLRLKNYLGALCFAVAIFVFLGLANAAQAVIPNLINYQARLRDDTGTPIASSTAIQFSIYNHLTSGAPTDTAF